MLPQLHGTLQRVVCLLRIAELQRNLRQRTQGQHSLLCVHGAAGGFERLFVHVVRQQLRHGMASVHVRSKPQPRRTHQHRGLDMR